jgi:hypothetical protein
MSTTISLDRRRAARGSLMEARRRYPRLSVQLDAFYESAGSTLWTSRLELSLRGAFFPCHAGDAQDCEGTLRLSLPDGPMVRARVRVVRAADGRQTGMALRFTDLSDVDRMRLAALLVRRGGLGVIPALEARFGGWAHMPHAMVRRELRHQSRGA